jgi:thioredoxin reductase
VTRQVMAVIGAGPAGIAAACEAARLGLAPLLFEAGSDPGGTIRDAWEVRNFPGGPSTGAGLASRIASMLDQWGIEAIREEIVTVARQSGGYILSGAAGGTFAADLVVVATGTLPSHPGIPGLPASRSRHCSSRAADLLEDHRDCTALVIGGSDCAFDQARFLRAAGLGVLLACRSGSPSAPDWLVLAALGEGVVVSVSTTVGSIVEETGGCRAWIDVSGDSRTVENGCVLVATGRTPRLPGLPAGTGAGGLIVAGDADGRRERYVTSAMGDGCRAARLLVDGARRAGEAGS